MYKLYCVLYFVSGFHYVLKLATKTNAKLNSLAWTILKIQDFVSFFFLCKSWKIFILYFFSLIKIEEQDSNYSKLEYLLSIIVRFQQILRSSLEHLSVYFRRLVLCFSNNAYHVQSRGATRSRVRGRVFVYMKKYYG